MILYLFLMDFMLMEAYALPQPIVQRVLLDSDDFKTCPLRIGKDNGLWTYLNEWCYLDYNKPYTFQQPIVLCLAATDAYKKLCQLNVTSYSFVQERKIYNESFCQNITTLFSDYKSSFPSMNLTAKSLFMSDAESCRRMCETSEGKFHELCWLVIEVQTKLQKTSATTNQTETETKLENKTESPKIQTEKPIVKEPVAPVEPEKVDSIPEVFPTARSNIMDVPQKEEPPINDDVEIGNSEPNIGIGSKTYGNRDYSGAPDGDFRDVSQDLLMENPRPAKEYRSEFMNEEDSNFSSSILVYLALFVLVAYFLYHYKNKLIALLVEGRRSRSGRSSRDMRHSTTSYSKLNSNLEEAVSNSCAPPSAKHVIY